VNLWQVPHEYPPEISCLSRRGCQKGAVYHDAIQVLLEPTGHRMSGKWVGFGRELEVNAGPWSLTLVDERVGAEAVDRWNRAPEES
jgi:hypothetical protein